MPDGLYEHDVLAWAEQQATLLRRLAAGERVNDVVDWPNLIEAVQDLALSELRSCKSLLLQAMVHLRKLQAWPGSQSTAQWRAEAGMFLDDAEDRSTPSMRQRLELEALYAKALRRAGEATDERGSPQPLSDRCPFRLDELLAGDPTQLAAKQAAGA